MAQSMVLEIPPYIVLDKMRGETPLEAINAWRVRHPEFKEIRAAYAGRLDPIAKGKLLVLLGDECKKLKQYTKLDKEYEVEILLDIGTDTGDLLGFPEYFGKETKPVSVFIEQALRLELGSHSRKYPVFSSKTVNGKALFLYALEGALSTITIPTHVETFYRISLINLYKLQTDMLHKRTQELLCIIPMTNDPSKRLGANFRQKEIRTSWEKLFAELPKREFFVLHIRVVCASGAYMRTLAARVANSFETSGIALSIERTKVGKYKRLLGTMGFWVKKYI